jgi:hypothetical protein
MKKLFAAALIALTSLFSLPASATYAWMNFTVAANGSGLGSYNMDGSGNMQWIPPTGTMSTVGSCTYQGSFLVMATAGGAQFYGMLVAARMEAVARGAAIVVSVWYDNATCVSGYPTFSSLQITD